MARAFSSLADRLLARLVPNVTARAFECRYVGCGSNPCLVKFQCCNFFVGSFCFGLIYDGPCEYSC